jgi:hypothetical protein
LPEKKVFCFAEPIIFSLPCSTIFFWRCVPPYAQSTFLSFFSGSGAESVVDNLGPILQNSVSAETFFDKVLSSDLGQILIQKTTDLDLNIFDNKHVS